MHFSTTDRQLIRKLARQYQVSEGAVETLWNALETGQGAMAQFNHPELGGMGQWMASGMITIGDFSNQRLKATVAELCSALAAHRQGAAQTSRRSAAFSSMNSGWATTASWWPPELGTPTASGGQNTMHYAYFAQPRRLAIRLDDRISIYDTGEHRITSVSQQQDRQQKLVFHSQKGEVALDRLPKLQEYEM